MAPPKNHSSSASPVKTKNESKTGSVYVSPERYTAIGRAALNVSNHIGTGRIITAGEMAQFLVDNYLELAWKAFAERLSHELSGQSANGD